jgi:hypothetical protein
MIIIIIPWIDGMITMDHGLMRSSCQLPHDVDVDDRRPSCYCSCELIEVLNRLFV